MRISPSPTPAGAEEWGMSLHNFGHITPKLLLKGKGDVMCWEGPLLPLSRSQVSLLAFTTLMEQLKCVMALPSSSESAWLQCEAHVHQPCLTKLNYTLRQTYWLAAGIPIHSFHVVLIV